jgi:hypothetical protein
MFISRRMLSRESISLSLSLAVVRTRASGYRNYNFASRCRVYTRRDERDARAARGQCSSVEAIDAAQFSIGDYFPSCQINTSRLKLDLQARILFSSFLFSEVQKGLLRFRHRIVASRPSTSNEPCNATRGGTRPLTRVRQNMMRSRIAVRSLCV